MVEMKKSLEIGSSPHITAGTSTDRIMLNVFLALLPVTVFAIYAFGNGAALVLGVAVASCVLTEDLRCGGSAQGAADPKVLRDLPAVARVVFAVDV